jgi:transcriptional regulator with PAS, ATPase and Fis domain
VKTLDKAEYVINKETIIVTISEKREILYWNKSAACIFGDEAGIVSFLEGLNISEIFDMVIMDGAEQSLRCTLPNNHCYEMFIFPFRPAENQVNITILWHLSEAWESWSNWDENIIALTQEIIDAVADGIIIVDARGIVRQTNKSYEAMANIRKEDYTNVHIDALVENGLIHQGLSPMVVDRKETMSIVDFRNGKDMLLTGTPVFGRTDEVICVLCNVRDVTELRNLKEQLSESKRLQQDYLQKLSQIMSPNIYADFHTENSKMQHIVELAMRVAPSNSTILLLGESGVGKGVFANLIHQSSKRNAKPMMEINCGSIPPSLFESELFGYEAGAFTGASKGGKLGIFELADKSTLFLDEIGDLPGDMQVKVLKAIQDKKIMRIGGNKTINVDVRIIAATNRNLEEMVKEKTFREDLYYRLNVIPILIPPLRERPEDIFALTLHFIKKLNKEYSMNKRLHSLVLNAFLDYHWPGNIRELENTVERLLITSTSSEIPLASFYEIKGIPNNNDGNTAIPLQEIVDQKEKEILLSTYQSTKSTRKSASILGLSQSTFVRKAKKHGIILR